MVIVSLGSLRSYGRILCGNLKWFISLIAIHKNGDLHGKEDNFDIYNDRKFRAVTRKTIKVIKPGSR